LALLIPQLEPSALRFSYPRKFELRAAGFSQGHPIARDFELINRSSKRRFDFNSVLIPERILAADVPNEDGAVFGKFPNGRTRTA
jgi:hypothetical protein